MKKEILFVLIGLSLAISLIIFGFIHDKETKYVEFDISKEKESEEKYLKILEWNTYKESISNTDLEEQIANLAIPEKLSIYQIEQPKQIKTGWEILGEFNPEDLNLVLETIVEKGPTEVLENTSNLENNLEIGTEFSWENVDSSKVQRYGMLSRSNKYIETTVLRGPCTNDSYIINSNEQILEFSLQSCSYALSENKYITIEPQKPKGPSLKFDLVTGKYSQDKKMTVSKVAICYSYSNIDSIDYLIPVICFIGLQDTEKITGIINIIEKPNYEFFYFKKNSKEVDDFIPATGSLTSSLNKDLNKYEVSGQIPQKVYIESRGKQEEVERDDYSIKVKFIKSEPYLYLNLYRLELLEKEINSSLEFNGDNFNFTFNSEHFWYRNETQRKFDEEKQEYYDVVGPDTEVLRNKDDNNFQLQVCINFEQLKNYPELSFKEFCSDDSLVYYLPVPDYVYNSEVKE